MDEDALQRLSIWIQKRTGIRLLDYKPGWLHRRLQIRMRATGCRDLRRYYEYISKNSTELQPLLKALSIGISSFFRDSAVFDAIQSRIFQPWLASSQPKRVYHAWSCACAAGQEAYSLSALWQSSMGRRRTPQLLITGSDVDATAIRAARGGEYDAMEFKDIPAAFDEYFAVAAGSLLVDKKIRDRVQFVCENVLSPANRRRFDLILCRNFLMFLDRTGRDAMMRVFDDSLVDGGFLVVGRAEVISDSRRFAAVDAAHRIYRKQEKG